MVWNPFRRTPKPSPTPAPAPSTGSVGFGSGGLQSVAPPTSSFKPSPTPAPAPKVPAPSTGGYSRVNPKTGKSESVSAQGVVTPIISTTPKTLNAATADNKLVMPKVDTKLLTPSQKLKLYYQSLDIKTRGYLPGGITPEESRARDNRERFFTQEKWFGAQPSSEVSYFGDKQFTKELQTIHTLGGRGTNIVQ